MKRTIHLVCLLAMALMILAGCAAPATQQAEQPTAAVEPTQAPEVQADPTTAEPAADKVGGVYRIMGVGDIRSLDPPAAEYSEDWWSAGMVLYNMLYFYDREGKIYPDLAADMPTISDDGKVYTIPVRQGVKFHNGRELKADDVKFTLERQLWPDVYSWGKSYMENVVGYDEVIAGTTQDLSGVKVIDDYTVEITLKQPQAVLPALLSMSMNAIIPHQETLDAGADWGVKTVVGTGPFKFVEWKAGEKAVYERNPDYFRAGTPNLEQIELSVNVDAAVQMLRYESQEAEFVHDIPPSELPRLLTDPELKEQLRTAPSMEVVRLCMHTQAKPFDDLKVRQAVAMAIDKQGMAKKLSDTVTPLEGFYSIPMFQYDKAFKSSYAYDPEAAKKALADAGYPDGIKDVKLFAQVGFQPQAEMLQADLKAIGIECELRIGQWKEYRDQVRAGEIALFLYGWSASFPDAFDYVSAWITCKSAETGYNDGMYCNPKIDELVTKAEAYPIGDPERLAAYREIEDIVINQDVALVGLYTPLRISLGVPYVHDDFMSGTYSWPYLENAWMEKK